MDATLVILTFCLVVITAFYAWQTRLTVNEMRADREAAVSNRKRDKSEAAARRALDAARQIQHSMRKRGAAAVPREEFWELSQVLDAEAPLIDDAQISDRVDTCSLLAYTASWPNDELTSRPVGSVGMVRLRLKAFVDATRGAIQDYLLEKGFDASRWSDLPDQGSAQEWILRASDKSKPG